MEALLFSMVAWLNLHTEYNMQIDLPNIVFVEQASLCQSYGITTPAMCDTTKLKGFYNKNLTIYLNIDFDPGNQNHQSFLLHELVHYVQWMNGHTHQSNCWGMLEAEAYQLQDEWRYQHHVAQQTDPFKLIMLEAACEA